MEDRSGLVTLAAYSTAAMLIVLIAAFAIFRYGAFASVSDLGPVPDEPQPEAVIPDFRYSTSSSNPNLATGGLDQQRIQLLESMLAEKTDLVRQQAEHIEQQYNEIVDLRQRYEDAVLLVDTLQGPVAEQPAESAEEPAESEMPAAEGDEEPDPEQLEAELMLVRAIHDGLVEDMNFLQDELDKAYQEISRLKEEAATESANQMKDALSLEAATSAVLIRIGADAVPALSDALGNPDPVVRRWAATVLGGMGQDARDASVALTEALLDPDPGVRRAAQAALSTIER